MYRFLPLFYEKYICLLSRRKMKLCIKCFIYSNIFKTSLILTRINNTLLFFILSIHQTNMIYIQLSTQQSSFSYPSFLLISTHWLSSLLSAFISIFYSQCCRLLVLEALRRGSSDNVTVTIVWLRWKSICDIKSN